jgi:hypothetical protein
MLQLVREGVSAHGGGVPLSDDLTLVAMKVINAKGFSNL